MTASGQADLLRALGEQRSIFWVACVRSYSPTSGGLPMMRVLAALVLLMCAGCAHNLPDDAVPNRRLTPSLAQAYVDMNGTFYPPNWDRADVVGRRAVELNDSLFSALRDPIRQRQIILDPQETWLRELTGMSADKKRVFIFLVGFNTNQAASTPDLEAMQDAFEMSPDDLAIRFYWDGHDARFVVDAARIWFWGTGSSQVAGQHGLRRVINAVSAPDREVVIVSYSRGASVVLAALSDPAYDPEFKNETLEFDYLVPAGEAFFSPPALSPGGPIRVLMLAPAIGEPDFWAPRIENQPPVFRDFPCRLKSVRYTINRRDYVLNKLWVGLADDLNPTDLGATPNAGIDLQRQYAFLSGYEVEGRVGHSVPGYLGDPAFASMARDSGLRLRGQSAPVASAPPAPNNLCSA